MSPRADLADDDAHRQFAALYDFALIGSILTHGCKSLWASPEFVESG